MDYITTGRLWRRVSKGIQGFNMAASEKTYPFQKRSIPVDIVGTAATEAAYRVSHIPTSWRAEGVFPVL